MSESTTQKTAFRYYDHDRFTGKHQRLADIRDMIPRFKEFYYKRREESHNDSARTIINDFNKTIEPDTFFPYTDQYFRWRKKWDADILSKIEGAELALDAPEVKAVKMKDTEGNLITPPESALDEGAKTLGGELMNDAMTMLKSDQRNEDLFEDEVLIKRRTYVLNVFNYVMRAVNQKESLAIKRNTEKRETAGFLMDLVRRSTAGKISDDDMTLLKGSLIHKQNEPTNVEHSS